LTTPFYITTAIDYANGEPHHGHAYEKIGADAIARYQRLAGRTVHFLTGLDEHGQKVAQTAEARGLAPQAFVDEIAAAFEAMWKRLDISYDQFIRTTDAAHKRGVRDLIERIHARNPDDFYEQTYEGWYCVGCELFKREGEIVDGHCVLHPTRELQWTAERNWFFRLTKYAEFLRAHFAAHAEFLRPESRRNEILGLLDQGLEDISITRSRLSWAIPFPIDSSSGEVQGTWVWFDALPNYLTATGYPDAGFDARWPAQLHVIGKDITRLHAVIWPAMLRAAELPLPVQIWAHGFVLLGGERFSKSSGVKLDLGEAIDRYGVDAFRYFLLREVPFDGDGNFSWERFDERYTADLANAFGNLASRVIAMVEKYFAGTVPPGGADTLAARTREHLAAYHAHVDGRDGYFLNEGLQALWQIVGDANEYVQSSAPWTLA
jgi:methionyl-tRNA synthetase